MTPEARLVREIKAWANSESLWCLKIHGSQYMPRGLPDLLIIAQGSAWFIEVKQLKGRRARPWQARMHAQLRKHGALVTVARSLDDVLDGYVELQTKERMHKP